MVTNTPVPHLSAGLGDMPSKEELAAWQREQHWWTPTRLLMNI